MCGLRLEDMIPPVPGLREREAVDPRALPVRGDGRLRRAGSDATAAAPDIGGRGRAAQQQRVKGVPPSSITEQSLHCQQCWV